MKITTILFDLDDTLYSPDCGVWGLIREKIDLFMISRLDYSQEDVTKAREGFFRDYGTTLRGLQATHKIDTDDYLNYVHDVPIEDLIKPNRMLIELLQKMPQKKAIFTNADRIHASRVLKSLQIDKYFDNVVDILDTDPYCKPMREAFQIAMEKLSVSDPATVLFFDDNLHNITTAQSLGMQTVWVNSNAQNTEDKGLKIKNINEFHSLIPEFMAG